MSRRIPLPFPNGWFAVCDSEELPAGHVRQLRRFGQELVVFRGESGVPAVLDAYCPHLGAHLGHGGRVIGESLRCPFHAWRFDATGTCVEVPYASKIPPKAKLRSWPVCEKNGVIMLWHHARGVPPSWQVPEVPECGSDEWTAPERRSFRVKTHPQEMAENICDPAHFRFVHGTPDIPPTSASADGHVFRVEQGLTFRTPRGELQGKVQVATHGFGFGITRFSGVIDTTLVITGAPIDDEDSLTSLRFMIRKLGNPEAERGVRQAFIAEIERQYTQDIPIWENKRHLEHPALCEGDGPIPLLRRWGRQFFDA